MALDLSIFLVYVIMGAQFESLIHPFVILMAVPLGIIGVVAGLALTGTSVSVLVLIGAIMLAGIVVNNAIVLLDYTRRLQRRGMDLIEATLTAGQTRLRPVLLTATTTILGLIPMATGVSFDFHVMAWATRGTSSQWWRGMAVAVIFGLAVATVLTLVVVPTLYVTLSRVVARVSAQYQRVGTRLGLQAEAKAESGEKAAELPPSHG